MDAEVDTPAGGRGDSGRSRGELDKGSYPSGIKVTDEQMAAIRPRFEPHEFHGDWNYTLRPPKPTRV